MFKLFVIGLGEINEDYESLKKPIQFLIKQIRSLSFDKFFF